MAVDKTIVIDLSKLNDQMLEQIDQQLDKFDKPDTQNKKPKKKSKQQKQDEKIEKRLERLTKELEFKNISGKGKKSLKDKVLGKGFQAKNLIGFGTNPLGFVGSLLRTGIPGFGKAIAATAIIGAILKKFDALEKKFTDQLNTKTRIDRENEEVARIQAGLAQDITSSGPGFFDPRDVYNSLDSLSISEKDRETNYAIRSTLGVE